MTPDISVIIPTYNVAPYIKRAIQSALSQNGVTVEIIIVDDASSDETWDIVSTFNDLRIKKSRHTENKGPSASRNDAITLASGRWIAVLDGDDFLLPDRLAACLQSAETMQAQIVVDNLRIHREDDGQEYDQYKPRDFGHKPILDLATFIKGNTSFLGGTSLGYLKPIFAREFLQLHHLSYDPEIRIGEDYMLLAEALACGARCAIEPTAGYSYTIRKGSTSHRLSLEDIKRIQAGDAKFISKHPLLGAAQRAQYQRNRNLKRAYAFTELITALKNKDYIKAVGLAINCPFIIWYLWRPIAARLKF